MAISTVFVGNETLDLTTEASELRLKFVIFFQVVPYNCEPLFTAFFEVRLFRFTNTGSMVSQVVWISRLVQAWRCVSELFALTTGWSPRVVPVMKLSYPLVKCSRCSVDNKS